jgi:hypothetical protein
MESLKSPASEQLAGFTIGVTAARRSKELITLLERRGSNVVQPRPSGSSRSSTTLNYSVSQHWMSGRYCATVAANSSSMATTAPLSPSH